jgi:thioredoxin-related protein
LASASRPTPVLADSSSDQAAAAFGLSSFPYFVFVNADGTVSSRVSGEIPVEEFRRRIDALER